MKEHHTQEIDRLFCIKKMVLVISIIQIQIRLRFGWSNSINTHFRLKIVPTQHEFLTLKIFNLIHQTKSESKMNILDHVS